MEFKTEVSNIKEIFRLLGTQNKSEIILLIIVFCFYFSYSTLLCFKTSISDNLSFPVDLYFSFDSVMYYTLGYADISRHPLIKLFTFPILYIGNFLYILSGEYKVRSLFITAVCCSMISMSVIYSFRYLKEFTSLKGYTLYLITIFYVYCGMNLILCFTLESFTFSLFLLSFATYYYSYYLSKNEATPFVSNILFSVLLGGVTMTNFAKGIIYVVFSKEKFFNLIKQCIAICLIFGCILLYMQYQHNIFGEILSSLSYFSSTEKTTHTFLNNLISFWGTPILLPDIITIPFHDKLRIGFGSYSSFWQLIFIAIFTSTLLFSIIKNYRNKLVIMLCTLFSIDIIIHLVLKYGIDDLAIYAGHWIFIVPLLLGWLYKSLGNNKQKRALSIIITLLTCILIINNWYHLNQFIEIAIEQFPPMEKQS